MALGFCPDCKRELSTLANSCPHCGYPGCGIIREVKKSEPNTNTYVSRSSLRDGNVAKWGGYDPVPPQYLHISLCPFS